MTGHPTAITVASNILVPEGRQILTLRGSVVGVSKLYECPAGIQFDGLTLNPIDVARLKAAPTEGTA